MACFSVDKPKPRFTPPPMPVDETEVAQRRKRKGKPFGEAQRDLGPLQLSTGGKLGEIFTEPRLFG
jgi:hypothetical protein